MPRRLNASGRRVRCQTLVSDSAASQFANRCEQAWCEMPRKSGPGRYFTTGDIADYTGLSQGQITKSARDPDSWLALFVVCAGKDKHCRFVDPTGWLLELWCGYKRVKRFFPGATRDQVFKALRIIRLEKGELRSRSLTQRYAAEFNSSQEGIYRPLSAPKPKRVPQYLAAKGTTLRERRVAHPA